ncbi:MAG: glycosyltransferase [Flavobacteriia bacterium]
MSFNNILIVGSDHEAALEHIFKSELAALGFSVQLFPAQTLFLNFYGASFLNKIIYRLGLSFIIQGIQKKLKAFILANNPSIVIVFKGMEITPKTLLWIKNKGKKVYNYNPDHPFIFSGRGSGNTNVSKSIYLYDYYFSYADDVVNDLIKLGVKSQKIPFGFDANGFEFKELTKANEVVKTCFLGNADKLRAQFINELATLGLKVDVFGENWHEYIMNKGVTIASAKYGLDFWITLQKYAVQLNLLRPHNLTTHNMRSFDIPGAGGIMLAPLTNDHSTYYENNSEVFLFKDVHEALLMARSILSMSFEERQMIRMKARHRSLIEHTYNHRVSQLTKCFEN